MKTNRIHGRNVWFVLLAFAMVAGFYPSNALSETPTPDASKPAKGPLIEGERFGPRLINDSQQGGIVVGVVSVPEK